MARKQHTNSISLFPFLAVLVCAMGSLILLLLVMTRKMQNDKNIIDAGLEANVAAASIPDRSGELALLESQIREATQGLVDKQAQVESLDSTVNERRLSIESLKAELERLQKQLREAGGSEIQSTVAGAIRDSRQLKAKEAALLRQMDAAEKQLLEKRALLAKTTEEAEKAAVLLHEKNSALVNLRKQADDAIAAGQAVSGTSTLLEFSNSTGTTRTPIVINVTARGFEILPNKITISAADMEGFPVRDNPLLSAVLTLHRHRSKQAVTSEPYVLLLVRPDGALTFYGAQRILSENKVHYGYELMGGEKELVVDKEDPSEVPLVRTAIEDALQRRANLYSKLLAIVQKEGLSPEGSGDSGSPQRRLTVRPDGRVMETTPDERRPVDGRFYAGGVAPPASLFKNRPVGGYHRANGNQLSAADAEKLAEDFAERYARQQEAARPASGATPPTRAANGGSSSTVASTANSQNEPAFETSVFGGDGSLQASQLVPRNTGVPPSNSVAGTDNSRPDGGSERLASVDTRSAVGDQNNVFGQTSTASPAAAASPTESTSFAEYLASRRAQNPTKPASSSSPKQPVEESIWPTLSNGNASAQSGSGGAPGTQDNHSGNKSRSRAFGNPDESSPSGTPDLSRVDPELLARLPSAKKQPGSMSTPIGITVFLDEQHMSIGQQPAQLVGPDSMDNALAELLRGINTEVEDVRKGPDEPVMPIVKFIVSPGGERWRIPLARSLKGIGVHTVAVYEVTPYMTLADDIGRARLDDVQETHP